MENDSPPSQLSESSAMAHVVERNIQSLLARQRQEEKGRNFQDKIADAITKFTGSMLFVYLHLFIFGSWIAINLGWLPLPKFDPSFVVLAMVASVEAIFLSTFVLITQNRMAALADARANLDLQISLLAEHEVTQILKLVAHIAEQVGVDLADVPELVELAQDVHPEAVLDTIETVEKETVEKESKPDNKSKEGAD
jgi:uncharacterized membrane protein